MFLRQPLHATRLLIRIHVRFYRKRRLLGGSHIPSLRINNSLLEKNGITNTSGVQSPEEFEKTLKSMGFEEIDARDSVQDLLLGYLKHAASGFKKSSSNLKMLQKKLSTKDQDDDSKLRFLFDYLIKESELEIRRLQTMNNEALTEKYKSFDYKETLSKTIESESQLEQGLLGGIFKSPGDSEEAYLTSTDFIYQILTDLNNKNDPKFLPVEQLVQAFELAKMVPIEGRRKRGIFLAGNLIYQLGNVRMDPVNESFYIDSLVNYGLYKKAFGLFESNKEKVKQRWWYEMGMMIALRANYLRKFDTLLNMVDLTFSEYPYVSPKVLKLAIKKKLLLRDFESANKLTLRFLNIIETTGCKISSELLRSTQKLITFESDETAEKFLNELEIPSDQDFVDIIQYHLFRKNHEFAFNLMARYLEMPGIMDDNYEFLITQMKLYLLKNFDCLKQILEPRLAPASANKRLYDLEMSFNKILSVLNVHVSKYQEVLFDSVESLTANSALRSVVEDFVITSTAGSVGNDEKMSHSKRLHCLLKMLLASGKEAEALKILSRMEVANSDSNKLEKTAQSSLFLENNAHHYAQFVEYYTIMTKKSPHKKEKYYEEKISALLKQMNESKVSTNAVLMTRLLIFYREINNFDECFKLINGLLKSKEMNDSVAEANRTNLYNRRDITRPLYVEIWKAYSKYYKIFTRELERVEKKSNYIGWKMRTSDMIQNTKIHPEFCIRTVFFNMVHNDNILPDIRMYYVILLTFMRRRDWPAIPAILISMTKRHGLEIPDSFVNYFMKGLEREFILLSSKSMESEGQSTAEAKTNSRKLLLEHKKSGKIFVPQSNQPDTAKKLLEQMQFLFQLINSETYSITNINAAMEKMGIFL